MKTRKYSDKFVDKKIQQIDDLHDKLQQHYPFVNVDNLDEFNRSRLQKEIASTIKHRSDLSFIKGFWYGYSLRNGVKE